MTWRISLFIVLVAVGVHAAPVVSLEAMIGEKFVAKDAAAACRAAEEFFLHDAPMWMKEGKAFKARALGLARAPAGKGKSLKSGDLVWIVIVDNLAASEIVPTPRAVVWVKAEDGGVFETAPKDEKRG
jgi:hypothetical protein